MDSKSSAAVAIHQEPPSPAIDQGVALIRLIESVALMPNVDVERLEKLLDMQERITARNAKTAYAAALSEMQPELPVIAERGKIDIGRGKPQSYALWEDINEAIKPVLARHGFAISFRTGRTDAHIVVTGVLSHREGHTEETTMHLPLDNSGSKNGVQAVGSSTSYGKRYTASALLNLTSRGEDDDGRAAGAAPTITDDQIGDITALLEEVGADKARFLAYLKVGRLADIPADRYSAAVAALEAKRVR